MNPLDAALLVIFAVSTVAGLYRGLLKEVIGVIGVVGSVVLAFFFAPQLVHLFGGGTVAYVSSVTIVFVGALIGFGFLGRALRGAVRLLHLGGVDRFFGALFGFSRALLVTVAGLVIVVLLVDPDEPAIRESQILNLEAPGVYWLGSRIPVEAAREEFLDRWRDVRDGREDFEIRVHTRKDVTRTPVG